MTVSDQMKPILKAVLVGDALGRPFNGMKHGHIQQLLGEPPEGFLTDPILFPDKPNKNCLPGLHSIHGQRLLASLSIAGEDDLGRETVARVGANLLELSGGPEAEESDYGALRDPGRPLRKALDFWRSAYPWETRDYFRDKEDSEGVSPAVQAVVPVCLSIQNRQDTIIQLTRLTHFRLMPIAGAVAVAELLSLILESGGGKKIDGPGIVRALANSVRETEDRLIKDYIRDWKEIGWGQPPARLSDTIASLESLLTEENDDLALKTIVLTAGQSHPKGSVTHVHHGFVAASIPWMIYRVLGKNSAVHCIEEAMNRGGESSAVCSLMAAMLVARHGTECLSDEWWEGALALDEIELLCDTSNPDRFSQWQQNEQGWTQQENDLRDELSQKISRQQQKDAAKGKLPPPRKKPAPQEPDEPEITPPPHLWLKPGEEEDPRKKKILKAARGKRKIDWKEERRKNRRDGDSD